MGYQDCPVVLSVSRKREVELTMKRADIERAQETAENLAATAEAARTQHQVVITHKYRGSIVASFDK